MNIDSQECYIDGKTKFVTNTTDEIWKSIPEFSKYKISNNGYIKNKISDKNIKTNVIGGYHRVTLFMMMEKENKCYFID